MEPIGVSASETPKQSKKSETGKSKVWFFVLCGLFVVIVGLVIAIVVVKNLPREREEVDGNDVVEVSEVFEKYESAMNEISTDIENNSEMSNEEILELYKTKIDNIDNEEASAMIALDYYLILMSLDNNKQDSVSIIDGLTKVDEILHSYSSANALSNAYLFYDNAEMSMKYESLMQERLRSEESEL